jgi:hypothetical protein
MKRKVLTTLTAFILIILPFLIGNAIGKHSPYAEGNSFQTFVITWIAISIAFVSMVLLLVKYYLQSFERLVIVAVFYFLLISPIIGIIGLVEPPDLSLKMLDHPEREHLRYIFLFIGAILFGAAALVLFTSNSLKIIKSTKWIVTVLFILAFVEFIWEFTHHFLYPEALKEWITQGNSAEEFGKNYDNVTVINIGVIGRLIQFSIIIWLSLHLYKLRQIKLWYPILSLIFSLLGIVSASVIYITQMNIPKGFEILFLFFIPGIPFLLFYWLGVALLTKIKKTSAHIGG